MTLAPAPAHPMRLAYLGTPAAAVPPLEALVAAGFDVVLVVTRIDKRRGRGSELSPSPVKHAALRLGLPVSHRVDDVLDADADLGVVVAFGQIIKPPVLAVLPMVNLHFSLLPRWRGAAPVERALLAGDRETGVCVMAVEEGLDTGGVYRKATVPIADRVTGDDLRARLVEVGTTLLVDALRDGLGPAVPQHGEPTYAAKIEPADLVLDWSQPAIELDRVVRVGGASTTFRGRRLKVLTAEPSGARDGAEREPATILGDLVTTGDGLLRLLQVQPEGRGAMPASAWLNGSRPQPHERLGA